MRGVPPGCQEIIHPVQDGRQNKTPILPGIENGLFQTEPALQGKESLKGQAPTLLSQVVFSLATTVAFLALAVAFFRFIWAL